ncbi:FecCD family ABC transporter permease [Candidatus Methanomassiliicoccus intestinalis]|uniref:FecCD family ABC transporter permease n=1 Tax=Candidatus Methanomassiliicoccus intestinalis TaxID=1406512 RepID=UPI0037DCB8E0
MAFIFTLSVGIYHTTFSEALNIILDHLQNSISDPRVDDIVWSRVPSALAAVIAGAGLAVGGCVMQTMLRNPLADPYTMGVSSGASLGASLGIVYGLFIFPNLSYDTSLVINAFVFSLIPVFVVVAISRKKNITPTKMILSGIAVMYVFSAITSLLMVTADPENLSEAYAWRVGTLAFINWNDLPIMSGVTIAAILVLWIGHRKLNIMTSGERTSQSLGVNSQKHMILSMTLISLMTAAIVSFTGTIGFIGLIGPHIARIFVGSNTKYLIPASAVFGALFLLIANTFAKVAGEMGLPVGVISALVGCPLFIFILIKTRKNAW